MSAKRSVSREAFGAVVVAAGRSRRFGGDKRKPFVSLLGRPLLWYALDALERSPSIRWIVPVIQQQDESAVRAMTARAGWAKVQRPCLGGETRAHSVANGIAALPPEAQWVIIHDGARPCLSVELIQRTTAAARRLGAVACGIPASLTVKAVDGGGRVRLTLDRESLSFIQTPQAFRRDWFEQAAGRVNGQLAQFPDDVSLLEWAGFPVHVVEGDPMNVKVTGRDDMVLAEAILTARGARAVPAAARAR